MDKQPDRIRQPKGRTGDLGEKADPEFPQLTKIQDQDRMHHIERALGMGMSREEAERHAEHDLEDREEGERTPPAEGPA